eukprot:Tbor_TRINITY_DN5064_c0_g1::TRINITY_DN5064_c0_g1_i2::g.14177::m.14177/K10743/RNASEH2A; ribonuclease H2 subunit A
MSGKTLSQELITAPGTAPGKRSRSLVEFDVEEFKAINRVSDDTYMLGIDEAGRGSIVGSMIYCGAVVTLRDHDALANTGAAALTGRGNNKHTSEKRRVPSFQPFIREISATTISTAIHGRLGKNLNTLSHDAAVSIIQEAVTFCKGSLFAVYVDTVGPPVPYERMLKGRFPHLKITVACKADAKFPIVSAASIIAKTHRDETVLPDYILNQHQQTARSSSRSGGTIINKITNPVVVGNGYPSDPRAISYIRQHVHRFFGYTEEAVGIVRFAWKPVVDILQEACVEVVFEADLIDQKEKYELRRHGNQTHQMSANHFFEKPSPRRDGLFHSFGLKTCSKMRLC